MKGVSFAATQLKKEELNFLVSIGPHFSPEKMGIF